MSEKNINKEAYKQAEEELMENKVKHVKGFILETLEKIECKKQEKERIEEELRILKLDLEDLRNGKFDKIEERIEKSKIAKAISIQDISNLVYRGQTNKCVQTYTSSNWNNLTCGTYTITTGGSGTSLNTKTFYF